MGKLLSFTPHDVGVAYKAPQSQGAFVEGLADAACQSLISAVHSILYEGTLRGDNVQMETALTSKQIIGALFRHQGVLHELRSSNARQITTIGFQD